MYLLLELRIENALMTKKIRSKGATWVGGTVRTATD